MAKPESDRVKELRQRTAQLQEISREGIEGALESIDALEVRQRPSGTAAQTRTKGEASTAAQQRLREANEFGAKMHQDLRDLTIGLSQRLEEIGERVNDAYRFSGWERVLVTFGAKDRAVRSRNARVERQNIQELVDEINDQTITTFKALKTQQEIYEANAQEYTEAIDTAIMKLKEAQPKYEKAKRLREQLEAELKTLELELSAGTISESERPAKEEELEETKRTHQEALLAETTQLEIFQNAQRAIPELQKNRDSAKQAIIALQQMRVGLSEKQRHFAVVLKNAMTAVKARMRLERYQNIDPAFNAVVKNLTEHNMKTAFALMETAIERAKVAPISPEESLRLATEMKEAMERLMKGIDELEEMAAAGARGPSAPSGSEDKGTDLS